MKLCVFSFICSFSGLARAKIRRVPPNNVTLWHCQSEIGTLKHALLVSVRVAVLLECDVIGAMNAEDSDDLASSVSQEQVWRNEDPKISPAQQEANV